MRIAAEIARAKNPSPRAEPKRLTSRWCDARHDSDQLSALKLSAPGADLEGEDERPIPAHSLTSDALDQRREVFGHLQAGKRHVTRETKTAPLRRSQEWPLRAASASRAARGSAAHLHACLRFRTVDGQERAPTGIAASPPGARLSLP